MQTGDRVTGNRSAAMYANAPHLANLDGRIERFETFGRVKVRCAKSGMLATVMADLLALAPDLPDFTHLPYNEWAELQAAHYSATEVNS